MRGVCVVDSAALELVNVLSLCSGIGGLDLGVRLALARAGLPSRVVCCVEREVYCCEILAKAHQAEGLACPPVWSDLLAFDGRPWAGLVDVVAAGYPCQPFSAAGKRKGTEDPRHLWPHVLRIVREVGPELVLLENVRGHLSLGFDEVLADLHEAGFDAEWGLVRASDVGAPHLRERLFVLAYPERVGGERRGILEVLARATRQEPRASPERERDGDAVDRGVGAMAEPRGLGRAGAARDGGEPGAVRGGGEMAYTAGARCFPEESGSEGQARDEARVLVPSDGCSELADSDRKGGHGTGDQRGGQSEPSHQSLSVADAVGRGERERLGEQAAAGTGAEPRAQVDGEGMADADRDGCEEPDAHVLARRSDEAESRAAGGSAEVADSLRHGLGGERAGRERVLEAGPGGADPVGDADAEGLQGRGEPLGGRPDELPLWPPGPEDRRAWGGVLRVRPELAPSLPVSDDPALEPLLRGVADGLPGGMDPAEVVALIEIAMAERTSRLMALGNAVVPPQAALAVLALAAQALEEVPGAA